MSGYFTKLVKKTSKYEKFVGVHGVVWLKVVQCPDGRKGSICDLSFSHALNEARLQRADSA